MNRRNSSENWPFDTDGHAKVGKGRAEASVVFSGDLCPINGYAESFASGHVETLLSEILPVCCGADLHITNLELPMTRRGRPIKKCGPNFRVDPHTVRGLRQLNVTHACLANNHIRDYGDVGIRDTLSVLGDHRVKPVGIVSGHNAMMEPLFFRRKGVSFCLLNISEAEFSYPTETHLGASVLNEPAAMEVLRGASAKADVTLVVFHGGREVQYTPPLWMRDMCRRFLSSGADVVIAHHAHVPQGVEVLADGVICYSLGNFIFDFPGHKAWDGTRLGMLVRLDVNRNGVTGVKLVPTIKHEDCSVTRITGTARDRFFDLLASVSEPLAGEDTTREVWQEYVRRDAPNYLPALRKHASSLTGLDSVPEYDAMLLYAYLAGCRTHREIMSQAARLLYEKRLRSVPHLARLIRKWEEMASGVVAAAS